MPPRTAEPVEPGPIRGSIDEVSETVYDVVIIGGGVYGITMLLEASRRGLRGLLVEQDDFGGGVSWASHRIIHGGLRYLQSLDLVRFKESVRERRWFLEMFPDQIEPLRCMFPLTNTGTSRPSLFRCAAILNNNLNRIFGGTHPRIAGASVARAELLHDAAPGFDAAGVSGVGVWDDGLMVSSERVMIGMLRLACDLGGRALSRMRFTSAQAERDTIAVECASADGGSVRLRAKRLINAAGPGSQAVARELGGSPSRLFEPMRAFNVLLDVECRLGGALAVRSSLVDDRLLFVVPGPAGLAIGTWEEPADGHPRPTRASVEAILAAACDALGRSDLAADRVTAVWSGLLPRAPGRDVLTPHDRPVVLDHGRTGGLHGAYSISGVKFTTARLVAERLITRVFPAAEAARACAPVRDPVVPSVCYTSPPDEAETESMVRRMIRDEAAWDVDDVCRRRTAWYTSPGRLLGVSGAIGKAFGMDHDAAQGAVQDALLRACEMRE